MANKIVRIYYTHVEKRGNIKNYGLNADISNEDLRLSLEYNEGTSELFLKCLDVNNPDNWIDIPRYDRWGNFVGWSSKFESEDAALSVAEGLRKVFRAYREEYIKEIERNSYLSSKYKDITEV